MSSNGLKRSSNAISPSENRPVWPIFNLKRRCTESPNESKTAESETKTNCDDKTRVRCTTPVDWTPSKPKSSQSVPKPDTPTTPFARNSTILNNARSSRDWTPSKPDIVQADPDDNIQHPHLKYKFLYPPARCDIERRPLDHPEYDEKTLYVPPSFLDQQTPALRQWWLIKQKNMDAILFFKMGKFYELFNEDAVIGVNVLDIMYMKGDETKPAHAGFPEISYEKYSKILIDRGYKVIRIEQTETPAMMEERCQETGRKGKFDKVVNREVCRVTTKGTQMLGVMESVFHTFQNQYLFAICESEDDITDENGLREKVFGFCFIDVTVGQLTLGQFNDDHNQSKFNILLAHNNPTEILFKRNNLDQETMQIMMKTGALLRSLKADKEFWSIKRALSYLKTHHIFQDELGQFEWPNFLKNLFCEGNSSESLMALEPKQEFKYALESFGAIVYYLQSQLIAEQVLKCVTFKLYTTPLKRTVSDLKQNFQLYDSVALPPMILDHIALRNLEIFENSNGGTQTTLFDSINYCKTHFGQRLLRNWLCSPLCDIKQIDNRLDAVEVLISNDNASLVNEINHVLGQTPDLERLLSKVKSQCFKSESDSRAIMFDGNQYSKAKISSFLNLLHNFKRLQKFIFSISKSVKNCKSNVLRRLLSFTTDDGLYPDYSATLDYFESAFDHEQAKKTGKIIPAPGVDRVYDKCEASINDIKSKLDEYLEEQKDVLRCRHIEYFGTAKNRYQIQVPDPYNQKIPSEYRIETTRKGVRRYYTPTIDKLFSQLQIHEEEMKKALDNTMTKIFEQFSRQIKLWSSAIECISVIDVLQSISSFVRSLKATDVTVCRPKFINSSSPIIDYTDGYHPALLKMKSDLIPNSLTLDERIILLSGANMGGKSTLMRQTALLVILAQVVCFVPASNMRLTPVDRIFSRLGASDRILEGESTFYTELIETSAMIRHATKDSLLLLDELGRGTSTYDGTAIAYSVLREIGKNIKCRCLFSTHYHTLVRDFEKDPNIRLAHMACKVEKESGDRVDLDPLKENITFLYKIAEGPVGRSYGFNVAKLAGLHNFVIKDAFEKARDLELSCKVLETLQTLGQNNTISPNSPGLKDRVLRAIIKT